MVLSSADPLDHRKPCSLCHTPRDVLIRCQIDDSRAWHFVCPGKCWTRVSGGVVDGDAAHPLYRYGGAWKNKWAGVSAKKPKGKGPKGSRGTKNGEVEEVEEGRGQAGEDEGMEREAEGAGQLQRESETVEEADAGE
ncbi:hypothetical protein MBLNU459_g4236t1 [Dothideomycetes sp. NU459]